MKWNVHHISSYANPRGNYGQIVNAYHLQSDAIRHADEQRQKTGDHYAVSNGLITIYDTREI